MASACSSSISLQKSCAGSSCMNGSASRPETNCSKMPSCFLHRKKPVNPLAVSIRPPKVDTVRQRVRSARMLKIRSLQSQLNDANFHLMELARENRTLKSTQRRQDKALDNYEGVNADLPRLIHTYGEDNRVLQDRNRNLKRQLREVTDTLKGRDEELLVTKDQLKQLATLAKDKHLEERAQLRTALNEAKDLIKNYENEISILNRKLALEVKNCRHKLNAETFKYKKCQEQLNQLIGQAKINEATKIVDGKLNGNSVTDRKSTSNLSAFNSKDTMDSDVKLGPIKKRNSAESRKSLTSPVDKIKARLATGDARPRKVEDVNDVLEKLNLEEEYLKKALNSGIKGFKPKTTKLESLIKYNDLKHSEQKDKDGIHKASSRLPLHLVKRNYNMHNNELEADDRPQNDSESTPEESPSLEMLHKASSETSSAEADHHNQPSSQPLSDEDLQSDSDDVLNLHRRNLKDAVKEYDRVEQEIKDIELLEEQIDKNKQLINLKREDNELVNEIWNDEYAFRRNSHSAKISLKREDTVVKPNNGHNEESTRSKKDPTVALENKRKLLAALRDIDNGNSLESPIDNDGAQINHIEVDNRKSRLMKELFG